jgi:biotin-dependent carboxylase-like uncharacterized protein
MNLNVLRIVSAGPQATVQDLGRCEYRDRGVPVSGAMDRFALRAGNLIVGNPAGAAGIEVTLGGFEAAFLDACGFALAGGDLTPALNGRSIFNWRNYRAARGDVLTLDQARLGCRAYICIAGGVDVPVVMGSRSTYLRGRFGGYRGRALQKADVIACGDETGPAMHELPAELIPGYCGEPLLRVVPGPQDDYFTSEGLEAFFTGTFELTDRWDRMGCMLSGPTVMHSRGANIISDGTLAGAVQVPGNGQPTILMADCQTTGGYPKIATVTSFDLPLIAQLAPRGRVRFQAVSLVQAREMHLKLEYRFRSCYERMRSTTIHPAAD